MAMINCGECNKEISDQAKACPHCGAKVPKAKLWLWIPLGLIGAFLLVVVITPDSPESRARWAAKMAIDQCRELQRETASSVRGTPYFITESCQTKEREFQQRYGYKP